MKAILEDGTPIQIRPGQALAGMKLREVTVEPGDQWADDFTAWFLFSVLTRLIPKPTITT